MKEQQLRGKEGEVVCQELGLTPLEANPEGRVKRNKRNTEDRELFEIRKIDGICSL